MRKIFIHRKQMCIGLVYIYTQKGEMRCQIFPMIKRSYCSSQRFRRRYKIYIICLNTISIQRRAIDTKYPFLPAFKRRQRLFFLSPPKKWSRFLVFNNHTRVAVFIKAAPKRLLSGEPRGGVSAGHPAGKPIISPSVCAGVSPTSPWISRKCSS